MMNKWYMRRRRSFLKRIGAAGLVSGFVVFAIVKSDVGAGHDQSDFVPSEFVVIDTPRARLAVARHEATVEQWRACEAAKACSALAVASPEDGALPMTGVSWRDVVRFIDWYKDESGLDVRLPSRDEWRSIAGAAQTREKAKLFEDPRLAWAASYDMNWSPADGDLQPVEYFGANEHGVFDLEGSVWEWTSSCDPNDPGLLADEAVCFLGRIAMGDHEAILADQLREPGKAGCGGGRPPAHVGFRLVASL